MSLLGIAIVLSVLKVAGVLDISWWWALLPLWVPALGLAICTAACVIVYLLAQVWDCFAEARRARRRTKRA